MASIKMQRFEKDILDACAAAKHLVHQHITERVFGDNASEIIQNMSIKINGIYDIGHQKARNLNKALAFVHMDLDKEEEYVTILCDALESNNITVPDRPIVEEETPRLANIGEINASHNK